MDPVIQGGMIFSVVVLAMVGSFILMYPVVRRLSDGLEKRLSQGGEGASAEQLALLAQAVDSLRDEVERLSQRQDFTERLLDKPKEGSR